MLICLFARHIAQPLVLPYFHLTRMGLAGYRTRREIPTARPGKIPCAGYYTRGCALFFEWPPTNKSRLFIRQVVSSGVNPSPNPSLLCQFCASILVPPFWLEVRSALFVNSYETLGFFFTKNWFLPRKKILLEDQSRVAIMLRLCLNFEDFYPKYAYKRYAYKKKLV